MKLYAIILSLLLQGVYWVPCAEASEADQEWQEGVNCVKQGEDDFAFMDFKMIRDDYPDSRHAMDATFAQGEYYFLQKDLSLASEAFEDFYKRYPEQNKSLVALAYLYRIAQIQDHPAAMKEYRKDIASFRQLTFIFNDKKSFTFLSGFQRRHKLVYYIDKVDVYVNGQLFTEVPF